MPLGYLINVSSLSLARSTPIITFPNHVLERRKHESPKMRLNWFLVLLSHFLGPHAGLRVECIRTTPSPLNWPIYINLNVILIPIFSLFQVPCGDAPVRCLSDEIDSASSAKEKLFRESSFNLSDGFHEWTGVFSG